MYKLLIFDVQTKKMKATKKQLAEITAAAQAENIDINAVLSTLDKCSAAMYKVIGAEGVVASAKRSAMMTAANNNGGVSFSACQVLRVTDKAFLVVLPDLKRTEKWIPKSVIVNDIIPNWILNK